MELLLYFDLQDLPPRSIQNPPLTAAMDALSANLNPCSLGGHVNQLTFLTLETCQVKL